MTITAVAPTQTQTDRQDLNDLLAAIVNAFTSAHPSVVRKYWSEVPASLTGEGPLVYQGEISETIEHDSGTRRTLFRGTIGYVDVLADPQETNARINAWADFMRDWFTANVRTLVRGVLAQTGFTEGELSQGALQFANPTLAFTFTVQEGRD